MALNHRRLLTCFVIFLAIGAIGSASAEPAARSSVMQHRHHSAQMPHRHSLYNYYTTPAVPQPDCYLPSDGCPSEHSIQN